MTLKEVQDIYEVSPLQELLMINSFDNKANQVSFEQLSYFLEGEINEEIVKKAWNILLQNHPILRTTFVWEDLPKPLQIVKEIDEIDFNIFNFSHLNKGEFRKAYEKLLSEDKSISFSLRKGPLFRITLIKQDVNKYFMVLSFHHLLLDGWSTGIIIEDFFSCYDALINGNEVEIDVNRDFKKYINWINNQPKLKAKKFWSEKLKGLKETTHFKEIFKKENNKGSNSHVELKIKIDNIFHENIKLFLKDNKITYNVLFQTVWTMLLKLYFRCEDVTYGLTVSGRPASLSNVEKIAGVFTNNLPIWVNVYNCKIIKDLIWDLQKQNAEIQDFFYTPLSKIKGYSELKKGNSLFESLFVFQNYPYEEPQNIRLGKICYSKVNSYEPAIKTNYPLTFYGSLNNNHLNLKVIFHSNIFQPEDMANLIKNLKILLEEIIEDPNNNIDNLYLHIPFKIQENKEKITEHIEPRTPSEVVLSDIWCELISKEKISIRDNFFEIGGHSLVIIQMIDRIKERFDVQIPVQLIFEKPNIEELALSITKIKLRDNKN